MVMGGGRVVEGLLGVLGVLSASVGYLGNHCFYEGFFWGEGAGRAGWGGRGKGEVSMDGTELK
jgi:hypothetical protein